MIRTIEYIEAVICGEEGIDPAKLHTVEKKFIRYRELRQIVMFFAIIYDNKLESVGRYYNLGHCTALYAKNKINGLMDIYKPFREKIERYNEIIKCGEGYKADYLSNVLKRLKKETSELQEQLKTIAI